MKDNQSKSLSPELPNSALFNGNVIGGTYGKGWDVKWDDLPFEHNVTYKVIQTCLTVHDEGAKVVRFNKNNEAQINKEEK